MKVKLYDNRTLALVHEADIPEMPHRPSAVKWDDRIFVWSQGERYVEHHVYVLLED